MPKNQIKQRIAKLRGEINRYRYFYHVLDRAEISDAALDSLKNELQKLERANPEFITSDSPTQRVGGAPLAKFKKVKHEKPMLSLFDSFNEKEMKDWEERIRRILPAGAKINYFSELKLDGLAISLRYKNGKFSVGATRGDGETGEDVSGNLKTIEAIPLSLRLPKKRELKKEGFSENQIKNILQAASKGKMDIRGEAVMPKKIFAGLNEKLKKEGKPLLANPRNGTAGSICSFQLCLRNSIGAIIEKTKNF